MGEWLLVPLPTSNDQLLLPKHRRHPQQRHEYWCHPSPQLPSSRLVPYSVERRCRLRLVYFTLSTRQGADKAEVIQSHIRMVFL